MGAGGLPNLMSIFRYSFLRINNCSNCFFFIIDSFDNTDETKELLDIEKMVSHLELLCYGLNKAFVKPVSEF